MNEVMSGVSGVCSIFHTIASAIMPCLFFLTALLLSTLPLTTPNPTTTPPPLHWALLIAGSSDPADLRHAAGTAALGRALAARSPATSLHLFLAHPPQDWAPAVTALVSPAAGALPVPPLAAVGPDVTPALVLAALTATHPRWHPPAWRLPRGNAPTASTALVFLAGHGGPGFIRVGGGSLTSTALAAGLRAALAKGLAARVLLVTDTCRAASLLPSPPSPFVTSLASAGVDEASHSGGFWHGDGAGGWRGATAERFTAALVDALLLEEGRQDPKPATLASLLARPAFAPSTLLSTPSVAGNASWLVTDFFGSDREGQTEEPGGCVS